MLCYIFIIVILFVLLLYFLLEFSYFLRTCFAFIFARTFKKRADILEETSISGICLTTDIDSLLTHMNNARFIRELDFAKIDFYERTGLYRIIKKYNGSLVMGATTIRYRKFIRLFHRYVITTKVIYWDDQCIYMEHRFITPSDNFINAIVLCRIRLTNCTVNDVMTELLNCGDFESLLKQKPPLSLELAKWIESNEISSTNLRNITNVICK